MEMNSIIHATAFAFGVRPDDVCRWKGGAGNVSRQAAAYVAVEGGVPTADIEAALGMTGQMVKLSASGIRASLRNGANGPLLDKIRQVASALPSGSGLTGYYANPRPAVCRRSPIARSATVPRRAGAADPRFGNTAFWIDGLNMAYSGRDRADIAIVTAIADDLSRRGAEYRVFWDASSFFKLRDFGKPGDCNRYRRLVDTDPAHHVQVTSGTPADMMVLMEATSRPLSMMITGDKYRDEKYRRLYPVCNDVRRFLRGTVSGDSILFPEWNWRVKLPVRTGMNNF